MDLELKDCKAVLETIEAFRSCRELQWLSKKDWKMFGQPRHVKPRTRVVELLAATGLSRTEAKKLFDAQSVRKTPIDAKHFVLTNKRGDRLFGLFRESNRAAA